MAPGVVPSSLHGGLHHFLTSQHPPLIHSHGWPSCKLQWTLTNIKIWLLIWAKGTSHGKQSWQIKRTQEMHWQEHPHIREETFQPQPGIYCLGSKRRGHATGTGSSSRQILGWVVSFTTSKHFSHSPPFFVSADPFVVSCPAGKTSVFLLEVLLKLLHFKQPKCQYFTRSTQMLRNPIPILRTQTSCQLCKTWCEKRSICLMLSRPFCCSPMTPRAAAVFSAHTQLTSFCSYCIFSYHARIHSLTWIKPLISSS